MYHRSTLINSTIVESSILHLNSKVQGHITWPVLTATDAKYVMNKMNNVWCPRVYYTLDIHKTWYLAHNALSLPLIRTFAHANEPSPEAHEMQMKAYIYVFL